MTLEPEWQRIPAHLFFDLAVARSKSEPVVVDACRVCLQEVWFKSIDFQINSFQIGSSNLLNLKTFFEQNGSYLSESLY